MPEMFRAAPAMFVVTGVVAAFMPSRPQIAFYETLAQVIPVLMIVIALEFRMLGTSEGGRSNRRLGIFQFGLATLLGGAELNAAYSVAIGHGSAFAAFVTWWALWFGLLGVVGPALHLARTPST